MLNCGRNYRDDDVLQSKGVLGGLCLAALAMDFMY